MHAATSRGLDLDIDMERIRPPYRSEWIGDVPGVGEFEAADLSGEAITDENRASWRLYHSAMDHGDFSHYIIPRGVEKISRSPLCQDQPVLPTPKERHNSFVESLDPAEHDVCQVLSGERLIEFESFVLPYLNGEIVDDLGFDISLARRWILSRVLELGWTAERSGSFDTLVSSYGYHSSHTCKPERMGKKYQWIAYHELLARLTDNLVFKGDDSAGTREPYLGPWQLDARDIDPSCLIRSTQREPWQAHSNTWWCPC